MNSKPQAISIDSQEIDPQQYWLILKRRWLPALGAFSTVLALAILFSALQKPTYQAQGKLLLKSDRTTIFTGVGTELGEFSPLTLQSSPLKTETEVLMSVPLMEKAITQLKLKHQGGITLVPTGLMGRLQVSTISGADILKVTFEDHDPKTASAIVNELMQAYIDNNISANRRQATATREFLSKQLPKTEMKLHQADAELRRFKERNGITNLEEESKALVASVSALDAERTKASSELADVTARLKSLQIKVGLSSQASIALNTLSQAPGVQQALKDLQQTQNQLAIARSHYEEQYPTVINLKQKEAAQRKLLKARVSGILGSTDVVSDANLQLGTTKQSLIEKFVATELERQGLASRTAMLSDAAERYRRRASTLPRLQQDQRELERRLEASQTTYETLLKRLQEAQITENQNTSNSQIIELASTPTIPIGTKQAVGLAIGGLLAVAAAIVTMSVLEIGDRSLKTIEEAKRIFNYTWLGFIPLFSEPTIPLGKYKYTDISTPALPVRDQPRSPASMAYRILQANLKILNAGKEIKTLVVTSSVPKEGKSTISANLAATLAEMGRRVLLIDADLYHPQQHHIWNLTNGVGLTNVIRGEIDLGKALNTVIDGLDVLTTGVVPPNPLTILDSKAMSELVAADAQHYDFVILDTSPLLVGAEALTLGCITDGFLVVVRPGVLDLDSANSARELLEKSGQNVLGMVLNSASSETEFDRFSYYTQDSEPKQLTG